MGKHVDPDDNRFFHNLTSNPLDFHAFFELFQEILVHRVSMGEKPGVVLIKSLKIKWNFNIKIKCET
jgi:hypothetical protein